MGDSRLHNADRVAIDGLDARAKQVMDLAACSDCGDAVPEREDAQGNPAEPRRPLLGRDPGVPVVCQCGDPG